MAPHSMYSPDWDEDALLSESAAQNPPSNLSRASGRPVPDVHGRSTESRELLSNRFLRRVSGCLPLLFPSWILLVGALLVWSLEPGIGAGGFRLWILFLVLGIVAGVGGIISYFADEDDPEETPEPPRVRSPKPVRMAPSPSAVPRAPSIPPLTTRPTELRNYRNLSTVPASPFDLPPSPPQVAAHRVAAMPAPPADGESDVAVQELDSLKHDLDGIRRGSPIKT